MPNPPKPKKAKVTQSTTSRLSDDPTKRKVQCYIEYVPKNQKDAFEEKAKQLGVSVGEEIELPKTLKGGTTCPKGYYYKNLPDNNEEFNNYRNQHVSLWRFIHLPNYENKKTKPGEQETPQQKANNEINQCIKTITTYESYEGATDKGVAMTIEDGYQQLICMKEDISGWEKIDQLVNIQRRGQGVTVSKVSNSIIELPVSCSTASGLIINRYHTTRTSVLFRPYEIPDDLNKKSFVTIYYKEQGQAHQLQIGGTTFDLGENEIPDYFLAEYKEKPYFTTTNISASIKVGEGILAYRAGEEDLGNHHAVVVIAKHNTKGTLIVLERDAGGTSFNKHTDVNWFLNKYKSSSDFLQRYSGNGTIGFLLKYYGTPGASSSANNFGQAGTSYIPDPF